jgi:energy-coupling factor transporter ATP-binding protein EcfA2
MTPFPGGLRGARTSAALHSIPSHHTTPGSSPATAGAPICRRQQQQPRRPARRAAAAGAAAAGGGEETFMDVMSNIFNTLSNLPKAAPPPSGADLACSGLRYRPAGAPAPLLTDVSLRLPPNRLGLVFGRSGAGKSTLLQVLAGLAEQSGGEVSFAGGGGPGLSAQRRQAAAGLVFQFPERHFVGGTLAEEITAGWPGVDSTRAAAARQALTTRAYEVLAAVGLAGVPLDTPLAQLSGGYKRRAALAVQLVRRPALLLLDEPLAGLDWRSRGEVVRVLRALKGECTVVVVSHDLRELAPLADAAWRMRPGGVLAAEPLESLLDPAAALA